MIVAQMFALTVDDVCYVAMPLFHSNALMAGLAPAIAAGATIALPTGGRFSASGFLADVRRHGVTYFNYVGKPLSYILATPERPDDADNPLVRVFGNEGAEADIVRFGERFGCVVVDSYGSTEGGATVQRTPDTPRGALGRAPGGHDGRRPRDRSRSARRRASTTTACSSTPRRPWASSSPPGGGSRLRRATGTTTTPSWPACATGGTGPGDLAYRDEAGLLLLRGTLRRLAAGGRGELRGGPGGPHPRAPPRRRARRGVRRARRSGRRPGDGGAAATPRRGLRRRGSSRSFLAAQGDLGTKWAPRFVRVCPELPITATSKVLVRTLRAERWNSADPVWWRPRAWARRRLRTTPGSRCHGARGVCLGSARVTVSDRPDGATQTGAPAAIDATSW